MLIHTVSGQSVRKYAFGILLAGAGILLLSYPDAVTTGINRGLSVCGTVILPTLFPFMLLSGILAHSPLCRQPGRIIDWLTGRLFGLPGCCGPVILLGLTGGYPAGMMGASALYRQGQITPEQWRRLSYFCICGGPGFIIGTVGNRLLGSTAAGVLLYLAQATVSLGIGIWLGQGHRREKHPQALIHPSPYPLACVVQDSCGGLLTMCGFVVLAAMLLSLWEGTGLTGYVANAIGLPAGWVSAALAGVLEVSSGCIAVVGLPLSPLWLSLILGWSGLSVQGQLAATLPEQRLLCPRFWGWRLVHGVVSGGVTVLLFYLFPTALHTGGGEPDPLPYSVSMQGSLMLLFLSFLAMLYFSQKKTGNRE